MRTAKIVTMDDWLLIQRCQILFRNSQANFFFIQFPFALPPPFNFIALLSKFIMIENASYYNEIRTCFISSNSNISSVALVEVANIQDLKALFRSREMTSY